MEKRVIIAKKETIKWPVKDTINLSLITIACNLTDWNINRL